MESLQNRVLRLNWFCSAYTVVYLKRLQSQLSTLFRLNNKVVKFFTKNKNFPLVKLVYIGAFQKFKLSLQAEMEHQVLQVLLDLKEIKVHQV